MEEANSNMLAPGAGGPAAPEMVMPNRLRLGGTAPEPAAPPAAEPQSEMMGHYSSMQNQASARYEKAKELAGMMVKIRQEWDGLVALGDTVTDEDVIKASSGIVAAGIEPAKMAGILADMPDGGEALQGWVNEVDQKAAQGQAQAQQALAVTRHQLGLTAFRHLIGHAAENAQQAPQMQAPDQSQNPNPLQPVNQEPTDAG